MRLVAILALGLAMGTHQPAGSAPVQSAPAQTAAPVRWEYEVKGQPWKSTEKWLGEMSDQGWELVTAHERNKGVIYIFRRPRP